MLGINIRQAIGNTLAGVQADVVNDPYFVHLQDQIEEDTQILEDMEKKITPDELVRAVELLFPKKFTKDEIAKGSAAADRLMSVTSNPVEVFNKLVEVISKDEKKKNK